MLLLAACQSAPAPSGSVMNVHGGRDIADFHDDSAQCDYEAAQIAAGQSYRPAPYPNVTTGNMTGVGRAFENLGAAFGGPNTETLWQKCMAARGWRPA